MKKPKVIVLSGYGLNCEEETAHAFNLVGGNTEIVHINDLIEGLVKLSRYQILAFPGGFSYGDDLGSGKAYALKFKNHLQKELDQFISRDTLTIGICNGFQILTHLSLLPGTLTFNTSARYYDRWVDLKIVNQSPWLKNIDTLSCPIAHGEGRFYADKKTLNELKKKKMIALQYFRGEISTLHDSEANPNGSINNIAGLTNVTGRILGIMPHPERAMYFTQLPNWTYLKEKIKRGLGNKKLPIYGPGLQIFKNAINYYSNV